MQFQATALCVSKPVSCMHSPCMWRLLITTYHSLPIICAVLYSINGPFTGNAVTPLTYYCLGNKKTQTIRSHILLVATWHSRLPRALPCNILRRTLKLSCSFVVSFWFGSGPLKPTAEADLWPGFPECYRGQKTPHLPTWYAQPW